MRKFLSTMLILAFFAPLFISCSDDDDDNKPGPGDNYEEYDYSSLTPGEQKVKLEGEGKTFLTKMNDLSNAKALGALNTFTGLISMYVDEQDMPSNGNKVFDAVEKILKISDIRIKLTWSPAEGDWIITEQEAEMVTIEFPSTLAGKVNNCRMEITGTGSGYYIEDEDISGDDFDKIELPKDLKALIFVDGGQEGSINVNATGVSDKDYPTAGSIEIKLSDYTLAMNVQRGSENKASVKLSKGSEILLDGAADLAGNLIDAVGNENAGSLGKGNADIKLMNNLVVFGNIAVGDYSKEIDRLDEEYDNSGWSEAAEKKYYEGLAAAFNKYASMTLASRTDGTKIATFSSRVKEEKWGSYTEYEEALVLNFNDETAVDFDVYFGEGFNEVKKAWEDFIRRFNF